MRTLRLNLWDGAALVVAALLAAASAYVLRHGPETALPMHFDIHGQVDRWGDRTEAGLFILACAVVTLVAHVVISMAAARANLDRNGRRMLTTGRVIGLATPVMVALPMVYLGSGVARKLPPDIAVVLALMGSWVVVALAGMSIGKTTPNPWIGVRVYWTYKSRLAWDKSNRLLGRIYFFGGVAGLILTPFGDFATRIVLLVVVVAGGAVASVIEAWRTWRIDPERTA